MCKSTQPDAVDKLRRSGHSRPVFPSGNKSPEPSCGVHFGQAPRSQFARSPLFLIACPHPPP